MDYTVPLWYTFLIIGFLLSTFIAYPTVALFVTMPIQRTLRQTHEDYLSDWIICPFRSGFYAMGVLVPFIRWRDDWRYEHNRDMVDTYELIRQAATRSQWWLSLWLAVRTRGSRTRGSGLDFCHHIADVSIICMMANKGKKQCMTRLQVASTDNK